MNRIVALDFETGGVTPGESAHVSLGVALMEGPEVLDSREWIFAPAKDWKGNDRRKYELRAMEVNGIAWRQILAGTPLEQVHAELSTWVKAEDLARLPVIAYNASFDLAMYSDMLFLASSYNRQTQTLDRVKPPLVGPWHCSMMLAQHHFRCPDYKLDTVAAKLGLARTGAKHGALEDAILAGKIFAEILGAGSVAA